MALAQTDCLAGHIDSNRRIVRELSDWNFVTTSPEVLQAPAEETLRVGAALYEFAASANIQQPGRVLR